MKNRLLLFISLILAATSVLFSQTTRPPRTVTNAELEKFREKRLAAEREYEQKYKELGFPSPEELRAKIREEERLKMELSDRWRAERLESQGDWQTRASVLRSQIASVEAQIGYLRSRLPMFPSTNPKLVGTAVYGGGYGYRAPRRGGQLIISGGGGVNRAVVRTAPSAPTQNYFPIQSFPPYNANQPFPNYSYGSDRRRGSRGYYGYPFGYFSSATVDNNNYTEQQLLQSIQYLEQQRAGLYAEWYNLAEEARRAGVKID